LIEDYPCESKYELESRERYHIENTKCVNKNIPTRTLLEYEAIRRGTRGEYTRQYYTEHKEQIKAYKDGIKEKTSEYNRTRRSNNIDTMKQKEQEYRANNRDKINRTITCELCGAGVSWSNKARHQQSRRCKDIGINND
jgi:hypothetical protein